MKIGIFTDSHYSSLPLSCGNRYHSKSLEKIKKAYKNFEEKKCDLIVCLGDLIDTEDSHQKEIENLKEIAKIINNSSVKTVCLMGNHDAFAFTQNDFYNILKDCKPENINNEGKLLMFLDCCYFKSGKHYLPGDTDWTDTYYPYFDDLKKQIENSNEEIYIFLHQNLDTNIPSNHCLYNTELINTFLQGTPNIKTVYQGHYHNGQESINGGIRYKTFPAMCEIDEGYFIEEI